MPGFFSSGGSQKQSTGDREVKKKPRHRPRLKGGNAMPSICPFGPSLEGFQPVFTFTQQNPAAAAQQRDFLERKLWADPCLAATIIAKEPEGFAKFNIEIERHTPEHGGPELPAERDRQVAPFEVPPGQLTVRPMRVIIGNYLFCVVSLV